MFQQQDGRTKPFSTGVTFERFTRVMHALNMPKHDRFCGKCLMAMMTRATERFGAVMLRCHVKFERSIIPKFHAAQIAHNLGQKALFSQMLLAVELHDMRIGRLIRTLRTRDHVLAFVKLDMVLQTSSTGIFLATFITNKGRLGGGFELGFDLLLVSQTSSLFALLDTILIMNGQRVGILAEIHEILAIGAMNLELTGQ